MLWFFTGSHLLLETLVCPMCTGLQRTLVLSHQLWCGDVTEAFHVLGGKWLVPAAALLSAGGNAAAPPGPGADLFLYIVPAVPARAGLYPALALALPASRVCLCLPLSLECDLVSWGGEEPSGLSCAALRPCLGSGLDRKLLLPRWC